MELKDVLAEFDIQIEEGKEITIEDIRKARDEKYIGRAVVDTDEEIVKKITGKRIGAFETELKRGFKNLGIEFAPEEIKDKKVEEIYQAGLEKIQSTIGELKKKSTEGNDKKLLDLQATLEKLEKTAKEKEELLVAANDVITQKDQEFSKRIKEFKIGHKLSEAKSKVQFAETVNDLTKKGFEFDFNEKYKADLDENDNLVVLDKDGNKIKNANGTGFLTFDEVYTREAGQHKLLKVNGAEPPRSVSTATGNGTQTGTTSNTLQPHPRAVNAKYMEV